MQEGSPRSAHDSLPAGTAIEDKYVIASDDVVGRGAWSVVKRCVPAAGYNPPGAQPGMSFVVKIIEKDYLISLTKGDVERAMAEVRREIDTLRHIPPHENVVTFIEHVETERFFLLFFEEVRCGDLCELILQRPTGKLHESEAKLYVYQLIKAVLHCHVHDVIHRDIKPENLLVSDDDTIKLTDFGLAKRARGASSGKDNNNNNTNSGSDALDPDALAMPYPGCERLVGKRITCSDVIGTPRYGAPEMFYAKFTQTHYDGYAADTWSIGVVTYIALSGSFPFSASASASEKEVFTSIMDAPLVPPADVTPMALDFVECLLNKDPTTRLPLYAALTHPWLAEVVVPRASIVATQIRGQCDKAAVGDGDDDDDRSSSSSSSSDDKDESDAAFATTMGNGSGSRRAQRPSRRRGHRARVTAEVEAACARFDEEARQLHVCIARLQHELFRLQRKQQQQQQHEQQQAHAHDTHRDSRSERSGNKSMSSRARTPCGYDDGLSSSSSSSAAAAMLHMRGSRVSAARARVVSPARALGATYGGLSMVHANGTTTMTTAAAAASNGMLRGRMASRDNSSLYNNNNGHGVGGAAASLRSKTPLARSAGGAAVRRGTPARTAGTTPRRCATPVRATTALLAASSNGSATTASLRATSAARTSGRGSSMAATAHNVSSASSSPAHLGGVRSGVRAISTRTSAATSLGWTSVSNNSGGSGGSTHGRATSAARGATPTRATAYSRPRGSHALSSSPATMGGGGLGATPVKMTASNHSNNNSSYSVNVNGYTSNSSSSNGGGGGDGSSIVVGSNAAAVSSRLYNNNTHSNGSSMSVGNDLRMGDQVTYKGCRAVVRFNGTTTFGAGVWIGLEMLEGNEGTNDGSSFIDKRQYFTCPKGKGVFVRASQVKRL